MKLIILSPNLHLIFSEEQKKSLEQKYDVEYFTTPDVIQNISILQSDKEKIIAIDPDFCGWKVTRADIDSMKQVKAICLQTTSFHYIDTPYCKSLGIPVLNLKGFSANAVAETVMMMMFALARKLPMVLREGCKVDFERYRGVELSGRKIGIIGLGRIGKRIAELGNGIGMTPLYWSEKSRDDRFSYRELDTLFSECDVIVNALAVNEETKKLFTQELLSKMHPTSYFISIAHIDHSLFIRLAEEGKIAGFACDVNIGSLEDFSSNILPGAELGWCTDESFRKNGEQWIDAIMSVEDGEYINQVN